MFVYFINVDEMMKHIFISRPLHNLKLLWNLEIYYKLSNLNVFLYKKEKKLCNWKYNIDFFYFHIIQLEVNLTFKLLFEVV